MKNKKNIIELNNINFYYNYKDQAIYDVNLKIPEKSVTAFIGPSGCGKSTLLRIFNRMSDLIPNTRTEGEVIFEGKNIYDRKSNIIKLRTDIGMIFQKPAPFPMSIYDNVAFGLRNKGIKDKKLLDEFVKDSLIKAALWEEVKNKLNSPGNSLSGGQQQRLCIARAIAIKPKVLLMDEPTSALDPISTNKIEDLIKELKKDFTIIIVTHHMQQAARISDYTAFFWNGKLIEHDITKTIFYNPKKELTEKYITGRI